MIGGFEKNSIAIYDRLHWGHPTFLEHRNAGNYFLVRCRDKGKKLSRFIQAFIESGKNEMETTWFENARMKVEREGILVRIFRIKNPRTKEWSIFVTNVPKSKFHYRELGRFYEKRWEVETSYRDLISTLKLDSWHSRSINGILQELFAMAYLVNSVKMQLAQLTGVEQFEKRNYNLPNFKLCFELISTNFRLLILRKIDKLLDLLELAIRQTKEQRKHYSRSYPRHVRRYGTGFNVANKVPRSSRDT
jgi:hypothetical protein